MVLNERIFHDSILVDKKVFKAIKYEPIEYLNLNFMDEFIKHVRGQIGPCCPVCGLSWKTKYNPESNTIDFWCDHKTYGLLDIYIPTDGE